MGAITHGRLKRRAAVAILAIAFALTAFPARSAGLIADLSHHLVAITTAFAGSEVLLFGTVGEPGRDVIVTVRGPLGATSVRRKVKVGFVWLNTQQVTFEDVPEFYTIAASNRLTDIAERTELARHQIGTEQIRLETSAIEGVGDRQVPIFRDALLRLRQQAGLFGDRVGRVTFIGGGLFRTTLHFPANVPPGNYQVQVFEIERGSIVSAQTSSLVVSKVGLEADLFDLSHRRALLYGLGAITLAVAAGWSASLVFKRG